MVTWIGVWLLDLISFKVGLLHPCCCYLTFWRIIWLLPILMIIYAQPFTSVQLFVLLSLIEGIWRLSNYSVIWYRFRVHNHCCLSKGSWQVPLLSLSLAEIFYQLMEPIRELDLIKLKILMGVYGILIPVTICQCCADQLFYCIRAGLIYSLLLYLLH